LTAPAYDASANNNTRPKQAIEREDFAMTLTDCRDNPVSTNNRTAVERLEAATDLLHGYFGDPLGAIDRALAEAPEFVMGHAFRAGLLITAADGAIEPLLRHSVEAGERLAQRANDRERRHLAAARAWLDGDFAGSIRRYGDIVVDYPRDSFALQVAHIGDFLLGQSTMLRDRVAQVLPAWDEQVPGFGYVLGMHAFGLEETNLFAAAEESGRRALAINPRDPWAIHAVAHVMEMQGRQDDGIAWLTSRARDWAEDNMFAVHNWWHLALFHLDLGEIDRVFELYDARIRGNHSDVVLDLIDASAMLWRLHLRGVDVGARWTEIADTWERRGGDGYCAFNDVHALLAFVAEGRNSAIAKVLTALHNASRDSGTNAMMSRDVGLPVAEALVAFGRGDYGRVIESLLPVRHVAQRFGGSNAQRDILHLTLLEAALREGRGDLARALAAERTALKPTSPIARTLMRRAMQLQRTSRESRAIAAQVAA
jgi:tetratricopeptide (TPR) repeat protein